SEMADRVVKPNVISYSAAMSACERGQRWEAALWLLPEMRRARVRPDVIAIN
ncbi:unnamed protein product, partial [Polarella glacialis]